ncbi:unnamed protein product [Mytilus coruscus]|uniref:Ig-like domain-containing protein n=1 Tax=Mytilus coruscus TaxID=42192 RepID=A0A6J8B746_MYTCO|nr:unnamed protein product [Mytilus coruscus]
MKLVCNVESGLPPETIWWKMNGKSLKKGGPRRIVYEFYPNRSVHYSNLTCEVMNNVTEKPLSKSIRLDIKYKPEVLIGREPLVSSVEGSKKKLCCEIDSNPNVIFMFWYKDFKTRIKNISSLCLVLEEVTRQDSGNYTCLAGNEIGNGSSTASLVVFYPPTVYVEYNNFSIYKNKRYVYCKAEGVPNNFTFFHLEHRSQFNEHIRYLEVTSNGIAELPHTGQSHRYQDTGLYMCNASNGVSDRNGKQFQQGEAYLLYNAPPVFVADNKKIQYGEIGKPMEIIDIMKKSVPLKMNFHGVNITAIGIEVTFRLVKLQSFRWFNITVCNNFSVNNFILEVRQTGYLKQRYRKRMITTPTDQTAERNSDESVHYIEIVDDNNVRAILHEHNNQMISTDSRLVVENRNISIVSEEQHLALSNNDIDTSEHTIGSSDNEINASEHFDDGYERPYTTLVAHNYAEDEHRYSSTKTSSINDNSTTLQNATCRPCFAFTEQDSSQVKQKTFFFADDGQENIKRNTGEYINLSLKQ